MFRSRGFITFVIVAVIILAAYFLLIRRDGPLGGIMPQEDELPLYLVTVIPSDWDTVPGQAKECNFDDDSDLEWFVVYRYDSTAVHAPGQAGNATVNRGPIGAAIFDKQTNVIPEGEGNPSPYRPSLLIPYRLLPDFYTGKGQGYLSEAGVTQVKAIFHPRAPASTECAMDEITILGYADSALPTRLSLFHWQDDVSGFKAEHFVGNARVDTQAPPDGSQIVRAVTTYNRLANHRSLLCESRTYERSGAAKELLFTEQSSAYTVDFCFGAPPDPYYPEGAVVALLRQNQPQPRPVTDAAASTGRVKSALLTNGFLLHNVFVPPELAELTRQAYQVYSVTSPGGVSPDPSGGRDCTADEVKPVADAAHKWICARESAEVRTDIVLGGRVRQVIWQLISVVPDQIDSDAHWRVQRVDLVP